MEGGELRAKKLSVQVPPRVDRGPLVERREWWTMGKNKRKAIQSSHRIPIRHHFLMSIDLRALRPGVRYRHI